MLLKLIHSVHLHFTLNWWINLDVEIYCLWDNILCIAFSSNNFVPVWCSTYIVQNLLLLLLWWGRSWWDKNQNVGLHMLLLSLHALSRSSWWEHLRLLLAYFTDVSHSPLHSLSSDTSDWWVVQEIFPAVIFSSSWDN